MPAPRTKLGMADKSWAQAKEKMETTAGKLRLDTDELRRPTRHLRIQRWSELLPLRPVPSDGHGGENVREGVLIDGALGKGAVLC